MKAVLEELLRTEAEAKEIVREAEAEARHRVANARAEAQQRADAIRGRAADETQKVVDDEVNQARDTRAQRLAEARTANQEAARIPDAVAQQAIESICRALMGKVDDAQR